MTTATTIPRRILVVANETADSEVLARAIGAGVDDDGDAQVLIVAPALNSRVRHWTSDDDTAHEAAEQRLRHCIDGLAQAGIEANGIVGDADPLLATADALRVFRADEIVIATHPEGRSNWLARNIVGRTRGRFGLPVAHIVVDAQLRREYVAGRLAA